jgi:hypothetical protein
MPASYRVNGEIFAFALVGLVAAAAGAHVRPDRAVISTPRRVIASGPACPLTLAEEQKANLAFEEMMPALMHPRCYNCHGGVNERVPTEDGGHLGGATDPEDCKDCHRGVRNLRRPDRLADWTTPPSMFFFRGRTPLQLCNQFKEIELSPEKFVGHITNENGGVQFTEAAYQGDRNLNPFGREVSKEATGREMVPEPPPISHAELILHAKDWAYTVGTAGWKIRDCGCRLTAQAWVGKVSMVFTARPPGFGTITERLDTEARFELDSSFLTPGDSALRWKTTSGLLKWSVNATGGECTTSGAGTAPMRLGGDENPWGLLRIEPNGNGALEYEIAIGPWPDAYEARFIYRCKSSNGGTVPLPGIMYSFGRWWGHPDHATVSADGKTIKGTFTAPHTMTGESRWVWECTLVR